MVLGHEVVAEVHDVVRSVCTAIKKTKNKTAVVLFYFPCFFCNCFRHGLSAVFFNGVFDPPPFMCSQIPASFYVICRGACEL
jgi:hypothetical protein